MLVRRELSMVNWMLGVISLMGISPAAMPTSTPFTNAFTYKREKLRGRVRGRKGKTEGWRR